MGVADSARLDVVHWSCAGEPAAQRSVFSVSRLLGIVNRTGAAYDSRIHPSMTRSFHDR